jgi:hypothetical protein
LPVPETSVIHLHHTCSFMSKAKNPKFTQLQSPPLL